jgi:hypothetical protein
VIVALVSDQIRSETLRRPVQTVTETAKKVPTVPITSAVRERTSATLEQPTTTSSTSTIATAPTTATPTTSTASVSYGQSRPYADHARAVTYLPTCETTLRASAEPTVVALTTTARRVTPSRSAHGEPAHQIATRRR